MFRARLVAVVTIGIREGRCKYCRDRILWVTTASTKGSPSRTVPFSYRPWPLRTDRNDETGIHVEWWPTASSHLGTCKGRTRTKSTKTQSSLRAGSDRADAGAAGYRGEGRG